jgi:hypothetical protein
MLEDLQVGKKMERAMGIELNTIAASCGQGSGEADDSFSTGIKPAVILIWPPS